MYDEQAYHKRYYAERRARRRAEGLCADCGVRLPAGYSKAACEACNAKRRAYQASYTNGHRYNRKVDDEPIYDKADADICLTCDKPKCNGICERYLAERRAKKAVIL
ncbi:MAG: hypothetical protein IJY01_00500 [Clostridia bacterium]|nr:hypothetical protein [Clostridia bacterium]